MINLRSWLPAILQKKPRAPVNLTEWWAAPKRPSAESIRANPETATKLVSALTCIRIISETMASLPLHLMREQNGVKMQATDHPLFNLLHHAPNDEMTSFEFREWMQNSLLVYGNAYAFISWSGGRVQELYPLMSPSTTMKRNDETSELYYTTVLGGETYKIGAENILHLKGPVFGELLGKSIVKEGAEALSLAMTQNNHASNYFKNASVPSGIIEYSGELEDVSVENLRSSWKSLYGGENSNSVAVLEYGMTFRPLGVNPHDSQLLESRKFQLSEIARLFRIPPHMIGELDRSIKANITQQALEFVQHTMLPWIRRWEERLWLDCLRGSDKSEYFFKFNLNGFLRGDPESRAKFYREMLDLGVFSVNKVLELEDQNKIGPEGDIRLVALNRANLEEFLTTDKTSQKVRV